MSREDLNRLKSQQDIEARRTAIKEVLETAEGMWSLYFVDEELIRQILEAMV